MKRFITYIKALLLIIFILTIGMVKKKNRDFIKDIFNQYMKLNKHKTHPKRIATIPIVNLDDIILDYDIKQEEEESVDGNISLYELKIISKLLTIFNPNKIFEFGTFDGRTTHNMALNTRKDTTIYTLDLPRDIPANLSLDENDKKYIDKQYSGTRFVGKETERKIIQLYGDSATFDFSPYFESIDFIFVDGSHSYEYVKNDTLMAMKLLNKEGGIILWHDYDTPPWDGVTKVLNEFYEKDNRFQGIKKIDGTTFTILKLL